MIIHQPKTITHNGYTIISARIELDKAREGFPDYIWYRVPNNYAQFLSLQSDAFLIASLGPAMLFGEGIQVKGSISPRLAYHLEEYMFLMRFQFPDSFQTISTQFEEIKPLDSSPKAVGFAFSGGVDSFFTLKHHLPNNQPIPDYQVSHALFIDGFDIARKDAPKYHKLFTEYEDMLTKLQIELIPIETNQANLLLPWLRFASLFDQILICSALVLGKLFRRFIVSSSWSHEMLRRKTTMSNSLSDRLLVTDKLEIIHFGAEFDRIEKIEAIHDWSPVQEHLHVCGMPYNITGLQNCSRCEKCMRTMIPIYAMGSMERFQTFSKPLKSKYKLLWWARKFNPESGFVRQTFTIAKKYKSQILPWMRMAALLGYTRYWILCLIPNFIKKALGRFGYFLDHLEEENAFDNPDIIDLIRSSAIPGQGNPK